MDGKEQPSHYIWRSMVARCTNPAQQSYKYYGARGITVCERWMQYENFLADMGEPTKGMSLDRVDNDKGYAPDNCRWATASEQQKNKRTTRVYSNGAFVGTLVECARFIGISMALAHWRWKNKGTFEKGVVWQELQKEP